MKERGNKPRKESEKERIFSERYSNFCLNFPVIGQISVRQEEKLVPTARATRGYLYCGVSTNSGR